MERDATLIPYFAEGETVKPRVVWPGIRLEAGQVKHVERRGHITIYHVEYSDGHTQQFLFWMLQRVEFRKVG